MGWYQDGTVIELKPGERSRAVAVASGREHPLDARSHALTEQAISYYQVASASFSSGAMRLDGPLARVPAANGVIAGATRAP